MAMKARARTALTTLVLLAAAGGAVGYALRVDKAADAEKKQKEDEATLFHFDKAKVKAIEVDGKDGPVRLTRLGSGWSIDAPVKADADGSVVTAILEKLSSLKRKSLVAAKGAGAKLSDYGLDKPQAKITLTLDDGKTETAAVGGENAFDSTLYLQPTGGDVDLVGGDAKWSLVKGLDDLREKRMLVFDDASVKKIDIVTPSLAYGLERDGLHWKVTAPAPDKADDTEVNKILGALHGLRATRFERTPKSDADYGLDKPKYGVQLEGTDGTVRTLSLGESKDKKLWARRGEGVNRDVAEVLPTSVNALDAKPFDLRDKTVMAFDRDAVATVRFHSAAGDLEVKKSVARLPDGGAGEESWAISRPKQAPAVRWKMSGLLYTLFSLKATAFADETGKQVKEHGLDAPAEVVTLLDKDGKELGRLEVGKAAGTKLYVRSSQSPRIYEVDKARLADVPKKADDIEDKEAKEKQAKG